VDWLDYNGHMTESRYLQAFADATDRFMEIIGCDQEYIATGGSYFTAETHIRHIDEAHLGQRIEGRSRVLMGEGKTMHLFHEMFEGERQLASGEHFLLHVSLETRKPSQPSDEITKNLAQFAEAHAELPAAEGVGRYVGQPR
jgi:carnitine 3-dehydrogenase